MPRYITIGGTSVGYVIYPDGRKLGPLYAGNAVYSAVGMRVWSASVGVVSTASPTYSREVIDTLAGAGIDTSGIRQNRSSKSLANDITYNRDGSRVVEAPRGILALMQRWTPGLLALIALPIWRSMCPTADDIPGSYLGAEGAHVCAGEYRAQDSILKRIRGHVRTITLDMPPAIFPKPEGMVPRQLADLSLPDCVLPSEQEIREYYGPAVSPQEGAGKLRALGARDVVVKLGERGSLVFDKARNDWRIVPIYRTTPVDITGAGDAYCGGFLVGLVETGDSVQAAMYGTVSASFVIEGLDATYALRFTRADAEERLATLRAALAQAG